MSNAIGWYIALLLYFIGVLQMHWLMSCLMEFHALDELRQDLRWKFGQGVATAALFVVRVLYMIFWPLIVFRMLIPKTKATEPEEDFEVCLTQKDYRDDILQAFSAGVHWQQSGAANEGAAAMLCVEHLMSELED